MQKILVCLVFSSLSLLASGDKSVKQSRDQFIKCQQIGLDYNQIVYKCKDSDLEAVSKIVDESIPQWVAEGMSDMGEEINAQEFIQQEKERLFEVIKFLRQNSNNEWRSMLGESVEGYYFECIKESIGQSDKILNFSKDPKNSDEQVDKLAKHLLTHQASPCQMYITHLNRLAAWGNEKI